MDRRLNDDDVLRALRALGTDHDPDVAAIRRRMESHTQPLAPDHRRGRQAVWLAAAAVILAVGIPAGVVTAGELFRPSPSVDVEIGRPASTVSSMHAPTAPAASPSSASATRPAPSTAPRSRTSSLTPAPTPAPTDEPAASPPTPARSGADPVAGSATSVAADPTHSTANPAPAAAIRVDSSPASSLTLSVPPFVDWVAVGTRADLKQVRAKSTASAAHLVVDQPASAKSVNGLFAVSWTGGLPEQDRADATRWLSADPSTGVSVTVAPSTRAQTLVLYCGGQDVNGTVTVQTDGGVATRAALVSAGAAQEAVAVTIQLPATSAATRVVLAGSPTGSQAAVYVAAVVLREGTP